MFYGTLFGPVQIYFPIKNLQFVTFYYTFFIPKGILKHNAVDRTVIYSKGILNLSRHSFD